MCLVSLSVLCVFFDRNNNLIVLRVIRKTKEKEIYYDGEKLSLQQQKQQQHQLKKAPLFRHVTHTHACSNN